jgi:hypothetical protein
VIERAVSTPNASAGLFAQQLAALEAKINSRINGIQTSGGGGSVSPALFAMSQRIDSLTNTTLTNPTISGGSISGATLNPADLNGTIDTAHGGTGLSTLGSNGQVLKVVGGVLTWSSDLSGSGGASSWATSSDNLSVFTTDPTQVVLIGTLSTSTTGYIFEVAGASLVQGGLTSYGGVTAPSFTCLVVNTLHEVVMLIVFNVE